MRKFSILFIVSCTFLIACEKEIPLKQDEIKSRIVVNSIFSTSDTIKIHLSESRHALHEGELPNISSATANLLDQNGADLGSFTHTENGIYILPGFVPQAGQSYQLAVSYADFDDVNAMSSTPSIISLSSLDTTTAVPNDGIKFSLSFQDDASQENFYSISVVKQGSYYDPENGETYTWLSPYLETNENYVENGETDFDGAKYAEEFFFSDKLINGQNVIFEGVQYLYEGEENTVFYVRLNSLSEDLYKYKLSYSKYSNTQGNIFAEPVQVYTNIDDGFGIFGGYSTYLDSIVVP